MSEYTGIVIKTAHKIVFIRRSNKEIVSILESEVSKNE